MKKSRTKRISAMISVMLVFTMMFGMGSVFAEDINSKEEKETKYLITQPYDYPIKPGTDTWNSFESRVEKIQACEIPDEILKNMTTEALTETVMNYPLLIDMLAFPSKEAGYQAIYRVFNGLKELDSRADALVKLSKYQREMSSIGSCKRISSNMTLMPTFSDILINGMNSDKRASSVQRYSINKTVYTPRGTAVYALYDKSQSDALNTEAYLKDSYAYYKKVYPGATKVADYNIKYNCHSYAWYSPTTSNKYWIDDPSAYMTDGSYISKDPAVGDKVYYSINDHSGIVTYVGQGSGAGVTVKSKWGEFGLNIHNIRDCPYHEDPDYHTIASCTFWGRH